MTATPATLVSFNNTDGSLPDGSLIADAAGDLYGITDEGGANGVGTVFEIAKTASGYSSTPTVVVSFNSADGAYPNGSLITDAAGDLFGTAQVGGANNDGAVFEIAKTAIGYGSTPTVVVSFNGVDGAVPEGSLITDAAGDLFGITGGGGADGDGTVFEIAKTANGYSSTPAVVVSFNGVSPGSSLITDAAGDLFGTTYVGGANNDGTVFEIANTANGYSSTPTVVVAFSGADGAGPEAGLITDAAGDLFGTTGFGGANNDGTVFEIANTASGYDSTPTVVVSFNGADGAVPDSSLITDAAGDLYGTTGYGGANDDVTGYVIPYGVVFGDGTVFEIANTASGYDSTPTVLVSFYFYGADGADPEGSLIADAAGDLYGTTAIDGANDDGTVFELTNAGFVVDPITIAGTQSGQTATGARAIDPFAGVAITDSNPGQTETITVTPSTTLGGTLSDPNAATDGSTSANGAITFTAASAQAQADLQGLVFTPAAGQTGTVGFTVAVTDTLGVTASDSTTSVVVSPSTILTTLVSFNNTNGANPDGSLITDAAGDLYGITGQGGANHGGTVFEIANTANGYGGTPTVVVSFNGADGVYPDGSLITDAAGDLFGTAQGGGANGDGEVFEIAKTANGYSSTPAVVVSFNYTDGAEPNGSLITDAAGDLFGTTLEGGADGAGTVFEIAKTATGYSSTPTVVVSFNGADGANPYDSLITDAAGDLFGTAQRGGANNDGTVFEIAKTASGYSFTPTVVVSFNGADGNGPEAGLITDATSDLYGTTGYGGADGDGTVFEIAKTASGYGSTPTVIVSFNGADGANPFGSLVTDAAGDLYGTTLTGGANGDGEVFEIAETPSGYSFTPTVVVSFNGADGSTPFGSLIADAAGDLYGTTSDGGANTDGTVFELTNAGFAVDPVTIAGTQSGQTTTGAQPLDPFAGVAITDPNPGQTETITVTPSTTLAGTLSDPNAATDGSTSANGAITFTAAPAQAQADLQGLVFTPAAGQSGTTTFTVTATDSLGVTASDSTTTVNVACYREGTRIATARGDVPVESLRIGDDVVLASGGTLPIRWIGRRAYAGRFLAANRTLHPVCLRAHALADNVPCRDLWVSPLHAMFLDGVLVPAVELVNGVTIIQPEDPGHVAYYHIELSRHDILLAEGAPSESFVDDDSRAMFHNAHDFAALYPNHAPVPATYCAPRVSDGFALESIRQRLGERAGTRAPKLAVPLRGFVDATRGGVVEGWARNPVRPELPVCLDVLVDGVVVTQTLANRFRADLAAAGLGDGRHAFSVRLPMGLARGEVTVRRASDGAALPRSPSRQMAG